MSLIRIITSLVIGWVFSFTQLEFDIVWFVWLVTLYGKYEWSHNNHSCTSMSLLRFAWAMSLHTKRYTLLNKFKTFSRHIKQQQKAKQTSISEVLPHSPLWGKTICSFKGCSSFLMGPMGMKGLIDADVDSFYTPCREHIPSGCY